MASAPLSAEAVEVLATDYFSLPAEEAFVRACHEETGGHPGLLFALFRELGLERHVTECASRSSVSTR